MNASAAERLGGEPMASQRPDREEDPKRHGDAPRSLALPPGKLRLHIDTIDVIDPHTVQFNLSAPYGPLLANFAAMRGSAIIKNNAATDMNLQIQAVGTGPYIMKDYVPESHFTLEIESADFAGTSRVERQRMIYRALGDLDLLLAAGVVDLHRVGEGGFPGLHPGVVARVVERHPGGPARLRHR